MHCNNTPTPSEWRGSFSTNNAQCVGCIDGLDITLGGIKKRGLKHRATGGGFCRPYRAKRRCGGWAWCPGLKPWAMFGRPFRAKKTTRHGLKGRATGRVARRKRRPYGRRTRSRRGGTSLQRRMEERRGEGTPPYLRREALGRARSVLLRSRTALPKAKKRGLKRRATGRVARRKRRPYGRRTSRGGIPT